MFQLARQRCLRRSGQLQMMGKSLKELLDEFPEDEREEILAETARLSAEYRALLEAARMAKRGGLQLSELRQLVETGCGKLRLVVEFAGQEPVELADIDDTAENREHRAVHRQKNQERKMALKSVRRR